MAEKTNKKNNEANSAQKEKKSRKRMTYLVGQQLTAANHKPPNHVKVSGSGGGGGVSNSAQLDCRTKQHTQFGVCK